MLITLLEITVYSGLTGFCVVYGIKMFDFLLDYNQFFWRIRYNRAVKAATGNKDLLEDLKSSLETAKAAGAEKVNVMADCYNRVADAVYQFKLWTCVYCMAIRLSAYVVVLIAGLLIFQGYGIYTLAYAIATMAFVSLFLKL